MSLVSTRELLDAAVASGGAVAGFNVITLEHAEAIARGAAEAGTAAILQLSENAIRFHGGDPRPILAGCRAVAEAASVPLALHLDHIESPELIDLAIENAEAWGLGSIMVDASKLDYAANVAATADAAHRAHAVGLWVEAELGEIGGKDGAHAPGVRTDPDEAAAFVRATGVDGLPPTDGLRFTMADDTRVVIRPSGTEPKVKCYLEVIEPLARDASDEAVGAARGHARRRLDRPHRSAAHHTAPRRPPRRGAARCAGRSRHVGRCARHERLPGGRSPQRPRVRVRAPARPLAPAGATRPARSSIPGARRFR